jgi:hypothetical protein
MKTTTLRDHPLLTDQGVHTWPPSWVWTGGRERAKAEGEDGILRDVKTHDPISSQCFLFIEHNGASFVGRVLCDSAALCQRIVSLLKQHRGEPLSLIGGLEIDFADMAMVVGPRDCTDCRELGAA